MMDVASDAAAPQPDGTGEDEALLELVRAGDSVAFERLYAAHAASARRLAVILAGPDHAEDLVAESFARILDLLREGRGPTSNFRAYLHAAIRNRHRDSLRGAREHPASDMPWMLDGAEPPAEELVAGIDANGAVAALSSLPGTWQQILWYTEVEGRKPAEIADLLAISPVAISSLAYRAREGLRRAYLDQITSDQQIQAECRWTRDRLSQYVRDDLSPRASAKVADHISGCVSCASAFAEMETVNKKLAAYVFPVVLIGGMKALETAAGSGASSAGPLVEGLRARSEGGSASSAAGGAAATGGVTVAGVSIPIVAAVVAGVIAIAGTAWAVTANGHHGPRAPHDRTPHAAPALPSSTPAPTPPIPSPSVVAPRVIETPSTTPSPSPTFEPVLAPPQTQAPVVAAGPQLIAVRPRAPIASPISTCDTYGSLSLPSTKGLHYSLVRGDGRQGRWAVSASPATGYVIATGAERRFSGDLGQRYPCPPSIGALSKVSEGNPASDPWDITVTPVVTDPTPRTLHVVYVFDTGVLITARSGAGWICKEPGGTEVGAGTEYSFPDPGIAFTCTFDYTGTAPPAVTLSVYGQDASAQIVNPTGKASLTSNGVTTDQRTFS